MTCAIWIVGFLPVLVSPRRLSSRLFPSGTDLGQVPEVLSAARDAASASLRRSDTETWRVIITESGAFVARCMSTWRENRGEASALVAEAVNRFAEALLDASVSSGHPAAGEEIAAFGGRLLAAAVNSGNDQAAREAVGICVRTARWGIDNSRPPAVVASVHALRDACLRVPEEPCEWAAEGLKQVAQWVVESEEIQQTYVSVVYYVDPFAELVEELDTLCREAAAARSYGVLGDFGLICEVSLAAAFTARSCTDVVSLSLLMRDAAIEAAKLGGRFGYLIALPVNLLAESVEALTAKGCAKEAADVLELIAEVGANGFRDGLEAQVDLGPYALDVLMKAPRDQLCAALRQVFTRAHYNYVPDKARRRLIRGAQERANDLLEFAMPIEIDVE